MIHSCPGLKKCTMVNHDKPPHMFDSQLKDAPDGDGMILTILYMNTGDDTRLGWGMRFNYCPACGKDLMYKEVKMTEKELILRLKDCESEIKKINTEQGFQSERIWELEKKLKEVENAPPFCVTPQ